MYDAVKTSLVCQLLIGLCIHHNKSFRIFRRGYIVPVINPRGPSLERLEEPRWLPPASPGPHH